jgi:AcrR family transcriptional regulator
MGYLHEAGTVLDAAVHVAARDGLAKLTFRSVGKHLGLADRTVVYYFPSKHDLVKAVLDAVTARIRAVLAATLAGDRVRPRALVSVCWAALTGPEAEAMSRLYVEALGLAAAGHEPYQSSVTALTATWAAWAEDHLDVPTKDRQSHAAAVLAALDGLLVLRLAAGEHLAADALHGLQRLMAP